MNKWGCDKCGGLGYRTETHITRGKSAVTLDLCDCVQRLCQSCQGDQTPPWLYLDTASGKVKPCECKQPRDRFSRVRDLFNQSNIPTKYRYHRLKEFNLHPQYPNPTKDPELEVAKRTAEIALTTAFDKARHFIEGTDAKGLFLIGPPGTGKTVLASMILNELIITRSLRCHYVKISRDFFAQLRATFNNDSGARTETVFNDIARKDVLVIDDFGIQSDSEWEQRMLYDLVDARYEAELPTIITSNIELEAVRNLFKGRIYSRLTEMLHMVEFFQVRDFRQAWL